MIQKQTKKAKEIVIKSYEINWPNISKACKSANILRLQFYRWQKDDEKFAQALSDIDETKIDDMEQVLESEATAEKPNITALIFMLKCRRRKIYGDKSYSEVKAEVTLEPLVIKIDDGNNSSRTSRKSIKKR